MSILIRLVSWLGILGTMLCVAGAVGVWYVELRIDRARAQLFERVDRSLSEIDGRIVEVQKLAAQSKVTVEEIQQRAQDFTRREARDRLAERFDIEARTQKLSAGLQQADVMLEASHVAVLQIRQAMEMGSDLGFPLQAESVDPLLGRIADIKSELGTAIDTITSLTTQAGEGDNGNESLIGRMEKVANLAARLLATFGKVDARLDSFRVRLSDSRDAIGKLNAKTHVRLVALAIVGTLFLAWMGAGQVCLWHWGRNAWRPVRRGVID